MEQNGLVPNGVNTYNSTYTYHYKTNSGKKFQIAKVSEVGSNPQTHTFRYDKNGCIDSIGTPYNHVRYLWDEESRLLAASYNGYVSSYIYDADGNRTVKLSAPYEAVYTNSAEATPPSDTLHYTFYVGPHYTVTGTTGSEDVEPRYVKHFFIGNKRVASKIANAPGYDPRGITTVAGKSIYVKVDYPVKYGEQKAQVSGNYTNFAMPYSNIDMNNYDYPFNRPGYWNGCVPPNNTGTVVVMGNRDSESEETDSIVESEQRTSPVENLSFFYHTDHLGSANLVTGSGPTLCHATEYLPYGLSCKSPWMT